MSGLGSPRCVRLEAAPGEGLCRPGARGLCSIEKRRHRSDIPPMRESVLEFGNTLNAHPSERCAEIGNQPPLKSMATPSLDGRGCDAFLGRPRAHGAAFRSQFRRLTTRCPCRGLLSVGKMIQAFTFRSLLWCREYRKKITWPIASQTSSRTQLSHPNEYIIEKFHKIPMIGTNGTSGVLNGRS